MSYYTTCPTCGAHLDPGERCDCQDLQYVRERLHRLSDAHRQDVLSYIRQLAKEEAAPDAGTSMDGNLLKNEYVQHQHNTTAGPVRQMGGNHD